MGIDKVTIYPRIKHLLVKTFNMDLKCIPKTKEKIKDRLPKLKEAIQLFNSVDDKYFNGYRIEFSLRRSSPFQCLSEPKFSAHNSTGADEKTRSKNISYCPTNDLKVPDNCLFGDSLKLAKMTRILESYALDELMTVYNLLIFGILFWIAIFSLPDSALGGNDNFPIEGTPKGPLQSSSQNRPPTLQLPLSIINLTGENAGYR